MILKDPHSRSNCCTSSLGEDVCGPHLHLTRQVFQAVVQSHQDLTIVVVLFDESDESVNVIRTLNEDTQLTNMLDSCLVFVAHNRSPCVSQMFECVGEDPRPLSGAHVLILQQVGVTKR